ncbi:hypothetical protein [Oribacterium sp. NK2B42]|uniref:hypothetical protein n=1 Tax=Oribacterium sp. NK2B42 TaxID=689781 RepID=UPI000414AECD|nr:hypothetical protein [Oribacterium sp. NK2B42]
MNEDTYMMIKSEWSPTAIITDGINGHLKPHEENVTICYGSLYDQIMDSNLNVKIINEKDLLLGELSAIVFRIGSYNIRFALKIYHRKDGDYEIDRKNPIDLNKIPFIKNNVFPILDNFENRKNYAVVTEISANNTDSGEDGMFYICNTQEAIGGSWHEVVTDIITAKKSESADDQEHLLVCITWTGTCHTVANWYDFDCEGNVTSFSYEA